MRVSMVSAHAQSTRIWLQISTENVWICVCDNQARSWRYLALITSNKVQRSRCKTALSNCDVNGRFWMVFIVAAADPSWHLNPASAKHWARHSDVRCQYIAVHSKWVARYDSCSCSMEHVREVARQAMAQQRPKSWSSQNLNWVGSRYDYFGPLRNVLKFQAWCSFEGR